MKLHLNNPPDGAPVINGYGEDYVEIAGERHRQSIVLTPKGLFTAELPSDPESLTESHLESVVSEVERPEVFLLGAGNHSPQMKTEWFAPFAKVGAPLEVMSLPAACRTYNIMVGDERQVIAVLLVGSQ